MRRLLVVFGVAVAFAFAARVALAADPFSASDRVVISAQGDVVIPTGDRADTVVVIDGNAAVQGEVRNLVVIDGTATVAGGRLESVVLIGSALEIGDRSLVDGQILRLDSTVHQTGDAQIAGGIADLAPAVVSAAAWLAPAIFMIWLGFGLATIVWALLAAGLAGRQLHEAERILAGEPVQTFLIGLVSIIAVPILAILLMVTVIGAPLGVGILIAALPLLAFAGYLVAATWIGRWIVRSIVRQPAEEPDASAERPFVPVVAGVVALTLIGIVPMLGIVGAIASLLGFGALVRLGFRRLRGAARPLAGGIRPVAAPTGA